MKIYKKLTVLSLAFMCINANEPNIEKVRAQAVTLKDISNALLVEKDILDKQTFIGKEEWDSLECSKLLNKLNRTQTSLGTSVLRNLFIPISDTKEINKRQVMVKMLNNNSKYRDQLNNKLKDIKSLENDLLSVFNGQDTLSDTVSNHVNYVWLKDLNTNKIALSASAAYLIYKSIIGVYGILFNNQLETELTKQLKQENWTPWGIIKNLGKINKDAFVKSIKAPIVWHNPFPSVFKNGFDPEKNAGSSDFEKSAGDNYIRMVKEYHLDGKWYGKTGAFLITLSSLGFQDYFLGNAIHNAIKSIKNNYRVFTAIKNRVANINKAINITKRIYSSQNIFIKMCAHQSGLTQNNIKALDKYLLDINGKLSINNKSMGFLWSGASCAAYNELLEKRHELLPIIRFLGLIDAYISISTLSQEELYSDNVWSFANFIESDTPSIILKDCWTPLIQGQAIPNSIDLSNCSNGIFTGPNGSGKSTIMKSIAFSILLGHSFGIVPAQEATLTKFSGIKTYLNIKEDLLQNKSAFMQESAKINELVEYMNTLDSNNFGFMLIDEPLTGTVEVEAAKRTYAFGLQVAANPYIASIIATHLEKPIELEQSGKFKNFHLDILEEDNKFTRTFRLLEGDATWWFKNPVKRSRFVDWLSQNK